jgi:3-methyl-2-oxobutanoate hydroxymethyltransferase
MAKKNVSDFLRMKERGEKITYMTVYDFYMAQFAEQAGIDMLLVGDSMGIGVYGYDTMIPTTMDQIVVHSQAVRKGAPNTFIIGDLPFLSYETSVYDAVKNAGRLVKEAGVDAVKPEGGSEMVPQFKAINDAGILVQGHIGMTGQKLGKMGGFVTQAQTAEDAMGVLNDAKAIEEAGAFSTVLVGVPSEVARLITETVSMPVYGFGAGPYCDGQVLITSDMLGITQVFIPRFIKKYANLDKEMVRLFRQFVDDVKNGKFPDEQHYDKMKAGEEEGFRKLLKKAS